MRLSSREGSLLLDCRFKRISFSKIDDLRQKVAHNEQLYPDLRATFQYSTIWIKKLPIMSNFTPIYGQLWGINANESSVRPVYNLITGHVERAVREILEAAGYESVVEPCHVIGYGLGAVELHLEERSQRRIDRKEHVS